MKAVFGIVGAALLFVAVIFGLNFLGFANYAFFAPKYEGVRRDVMIESRAYSEATTREMYRLKLQYTQAKTPEEKDTIAAMAKHEAQAFDISRLPLDLQYFIKSL